MKQLTFFDEASLITEESWSKIMAYFSEREKSKGRFYNFKQHKEKIMEIAEARDLRSEAERKIKEILIDLEKHVSLTVVEVKIRREGVMKASQFSVPEISKIEIDLKL